ncbi:MAG: enoyl-CoA hydratase/isomerase family protein [Gemmataceae bacterium]|nr:enoyl-CoA hydratase/isomerase family protein [Gemmataceae bacterium]
MGDYQTILYELEGGVATLTINRPAARNGMTNRMLKETHDALTRAAADPHVRVLVLTGAGTSFCPGADLKRATAPRDDAAPEPPNEARNFQVPVLLHEMPAITVAAVNGACAGAGLGWACGCDLRVAARSAMFNTAFLNVAVAGDMGLPWSLPRLIGGARARELSFFTEKFTAEDALRYGLVARVWDDERFAAEVRHMAERLAGSSAAALRAMKAQYVAAERMDFTDFVALETEDHFRISTSADTREAFLAFVEKRPPRFAE